MPIDIQTVVLCTICLVAAAGYLAASWASVPIIAGLSKAAASTSFIALAVVNGAAYSDYGRFVLIALGLSWVGDICLLSRQSNFLLAGIAAFFTAHIAFTAAFTQLSLDTAYLVIAFVCLSVAGSLILKWLWKYLQGPYRLGIPAYVLVMIVMASLAVGASIVPSVGTAAILFVISDVSVARDRFVKQDIVNKTWGLPLYYIAQLLFAASVITAV